MPSAHEIILYLVSHIHYNHFTRQTTKTQGASAITSTQIQKFINGYAGTSKSHITILVGTLKRIFSSAYADGIIERDPTVALVQPKATSATEKRALTAEETARIEDGRR